jgi:hypothetical protein
MKKENTNGNGATANGKKTVVEFDFGKNNDNDAIRSLIKAVKMTRKRLYPERYDEKGKLKVECVK